ncbi:MAG: MurR/RpiR family transcriptional regulator [Clostridia bacterium]|jgi:DNA-binding MurR/RpiR family transcriptional regulator|nr:MurR/RpiR family transcriptional regulator [Clostridia bacterium]
MSDCLMRLRYAADELAAAQRRVAEYLSDNAERIIGMPIEQVAAACQTSKATVVRLCKQLGYPGYKGLCNALSADLALGGPERISYSEIGREQDMRTVMQNVTAYAISAVTETTRVQEEEVFRQAVQTLIGAPRVDFFGIGSSGLVAMDAQHKMLRAGKYSQTSADSHTQVVMAASLRPGDAAVLFSYTGETQETLDALKAARRAGAATLSVTRYGGNRLSRAADIALFVAAPEKQVRIAAMSSRIAMMHLVDLLFSAYTAMAYDTAKPYLDKTLLAVLDRRGTRERSLK